MNRVSALVVGLGLVLVLPSCGGKSGDTAATSTSSGSATSGATGGSSGSTVAAVSKYDAGPRAGESPVDHEKAEAGAKLFTAKGCSACHAFGKRLTCPDLAGVSMRRTSEWMENQILHPEVMTKEDPISHGLFAQFALQMPNQKLTPDEAKAVIEYFKQMDHPSGSKESDHK